MNKFLLGLYAVLIVLAVLGSVLVPFLFIVMIPVVWIVLTLLMWELWRWVRKNSAGEWYSKNIVFAAGIILWLFASFWYGGGQKYYYDAKVKRLCAKDGGVKVYETVMLPPERFNEWGQVPFFRNTPSEDALGPEYVYRDEVIYLRKGNPNIRKMHMQIFRKSDMKLLGEVTYYNRGGGDFIFGFTPGSEFWCPAATNEVILNTKVFIKGKDHDDDHN